jgi:hypothetical protein
VGTGEGIELRIADHPSSIGMLCGSELEENNKGHSESEQGQESGRNCHRPVYPVAAWVVGYVYLGLAGWAFWLAAVMPGR